jgi:hypothetical protein
MQVQAGIIQSSFLLRMSDVIFYVSVILVVLN